jgi:REase_MTES_1575
VPQLNVSTIGRLDFAVFIPGLGEGLPIVVVECDGHQFHERTVQQASKDRRRDRMLQRCGVPILRFTGTDVVRGSAEFAQEIADFIDGRAEEKEFRWFQDHGIDIDRVMREGGGFYAPYQWPRIRAGSELSAHVREQEGG